MNFWRIGDVLVYGKDFEDAKRFHDYIEQKNRDGDRAMDIDALVKETDTNVIETDPVEEINRWLRDEAFESDLIEWWNEYCDRNRYYDDRIEQYGNAEDYVKRTYCDYESMFEELNRMYSDNTPYYGEYIKPDNGYGATVGDFGDVWDDYNYDTLAEFFYQENYSPDDAISDIIDEFGALEDQYEDEELDYQEWLEANEVKK